MTRERKQQYDLYLNTAATGTVKAANAVCLESDGRLSAFGFRYTAEFLANKHAFALDPVQLPLTAREFQLQCSGGTPGLLDDYLPDDWGRRVLAYLAFYRDKKTINNHSCIDTLAQLSTSRIGAIQWTMPDALPQLDLGCDFAQLAHAENAAQHIEESPLDQANFDELSLLYLANAGTGIGGARPKALINKNNSPYLAKFNRLSKDDYNNARVELACLRMAKAAGINAGDGSIEPGINNREVLLLKRFDVNDKDQSRNHLLSINVLLKSTTNQSDHSGVFRYDDIADIIRKHSVHVEHDLKQLLHIMLFNRGINNIDDHERNFSLINKGEGYCLSPAYDMLPSLSRGAYHVAGYGHHPSPPLASQVTKLGKVFGLPKTEIANAADTVINALKHWPEFADSTNVCEKDHDKIAAVIRC